MSVWCVCVHVCVCACARGRMLGGPEVVVGICGCVCVVGGGRQDLEGEGKYWVVVGVCV